MKYLKNFLLICLILSFAGAASAKDSNKKADLVLAENQVLPFGLKLLTNNQVVVSSKHSSSSASQNNFAVQVPSTSGHKRFWSSEYAKQFEQLGWSAVDVPNTMHILTKNENACNTQIFIFEFGPNITEDMRKSIQSDLEFDRDVIVFHYQQKGDCESIN